MNHQPTANKTRSTDNNPMIDETYPPANGPETQEPYPPERRGVKVEVVPYNPAWPSQFEAIKADLIFDLALVNAKYTSIEHIGSTSVPELAAKAEIDIIILIADAAHYEAIEEGLIWGERQGGYRPIGSGGVEGRWSFKLHGILPLRNVYVEVEGSPKLRGHRDLRARLREDPESRNEYARVKMELAERTWNHGVMEYAIAKNAVVRKILKRSGWTEEEIDEKEQRVQLLSDGPEDWF